MGNDSIREIRVDEKLGWGKSLFYGFQSVIALNLFLGAMCIMVLMSGFRSMHHVELNDRNILIIGIPIFITVCVSLLPAEIVNSMPTLLSFLFSSSITVGALVAVIVNLIIPQESASPA